MKLPQLVYDCDKCGACCQHLIIEAQHVDVLREPAIAEYGTLLDGHGKIPFEDAAWGLGRPPDFRCEFLLDDKTCGIYKTRPECCVAMVAGGEQCQMARTRPISHRSGP